MIWEIPIIGDFITKPFKVATLYEFYDRFHLFTIYVISVFVVLISAKQHFGNPIDCMLPKQHDDLKSWREYIHNFCLFYGTFRFEVNNGDNETSFFNYAGYKDDYTVFYYQWVPFFLAFQVCSFLFPFFCWQYMQKLIYLDMSFIVDYAGKINEEKELDKIKKRVDRIVDYMNDHFKFRRAHKMGYFSWITFNPAFPSILYGLTKLLFIGNVLLQIKLVCKFLSVDSWTWGFDLVEKFLYPPKRSPDFYTWSDKQKFVSILSEGTYNRFQYFPILVGCEYQLHESVNHLVNHKAQCIIPLNVYNEKIFIGLYFWFLVLAALSVIGAFKWIIRLKNNKQNELMVYKLIKKTLEKKKYGHSVHDDMRYNFVHKYLCADGIFLIYFMLDTNGFLKTEEIIGALFANYCKENQVLPLQSAPPFPKKSERSDYSEVNYGFDHKQKI